MLIMLGYWMIVILCCSGMHRITGQEPKFISVLFRHGDRAPDSYMLDYQFLYSVGELSNVGKQREYELGQHIRREYGKFLGQTYYPRIAITRSVNIDRSKMSLQLVMAGIFPPTKVQQWNKHIHWQPVIVDQVPSVYDFLLHPFSCPKYAEEIKVVMQLSEVQREISKFNNLMINLTEWVGKPITKPSDLSRLYDDLTSIKSMGLDLPDWTNGIFPNGALKDAQFLNRKILNYNQILRKLNGGMILKNFTDSMSAVVNGDWKSDTKILLLSGHHTNIAALLIALGFRKFPEPQYSAALFVELLEDNHRYYVRLFYYAGIPAARIALAIPNCGYLCPFDDFIELYRNILPTDEEMCSIGSVFLKL